MIEYMLTKHAETMLKERGIQIDWLERVLLNPSQQHMDLTDPALKHAIGPSSKTAIDCFASSIMTP